MYTKPIETFRSLPATALASLARDFPDGEVVVDRQLVSSLINRDKVAPGRVAALLTTNAPSGIRRLYEVARTDLTEVPMPPDLKASVRALRDSVDQYLLRLVASTMSGATEWAAISEVEFVNVTVAAGKLVTGGNAAEKEHWIWYWTAMAFAEVALARAMLHATGMATHRELTMLVDHYCDCIGDYRQFADEFPWEDGPAAEIVADVIGLEE